MSVIIMGIAWEANLPQREKFVLLAYADHADHNGNNVFPSVGLIAWKTGYSPRSVQRITKQLLDKGIMVPDGTSQYQTNKYKIVIEAIPRLAPYTRGDSLSPPIYGGDILTGEGVTNWQGGDKTAPGGVTKRQGGGDTAMSPEPSLTVIKPSLLSPDAILCEASSLSAFPGNQLQWIEVVIQLAKDHGNEKTIAAMKNACNRWVNTRNQKGMFYQKTDLRWINWAQEELASTGRIEKDTSKMTQDELMDYLLSKDMENDNHTVPT